MNAHIYSTNYPPTLASAVTNQSVPDWLLLPGLLMSESGIILVALGSWLLLNTMIQTPLIICGAILCFLGIVLVPSWLIYRMKVLSGALPTTGDQAP